MENNNYDHIHELQKRITDLEIKVLKMSHVVSDAYESLDTDLINTSLAKAQGEFPELGPNRENPHWKSLYTDLHGILVFIRPVLSKHGLAITQQTQIDSAGVTMLHTRLRHTSGQWIECRLRVIPVRNDPQAFGAALTYQKRYALMSLLGITVGHDPLDDDAETEMDVVRNQKYKGTSVNLSYDKKQQSVETISKDQLEEMEYELSEYPDIAEMIMEKMRIQALADYPKSEYITGMKRIREIKLARKESK